MRFRGHAKGRIRGRSQVRFRRFLCVASSPARRRSHTSDTPLPSGVTQPMPPMRRFMACAA